MRSIYSMIRTLRRLQTPFPALQIWISKWNFYHQIQHLRLYFQCKFNDIPTNRRIFIEFKRTVQLAWNLKAKPTQKCWKIRVKMNESFTGWSRFDWNGQPSNQIGQLWRHCTLIFKSGSERNQNTSATNWCRHFHSEWMEIRFGYLMKQICERISAVTPGRVPVAIGLNSFRYGRQRWDAGWRVHSFHSFHKWN